MVKATLAKYNANFYTEAKTILSGRLIWCSIDTWEMWIHYALANIHGVRGRGTDGRTKNDCLTFHGYLPTTIWDIHIQPIYGLIVLIFVSI